MPTLKPKQDLKQRQQVMLNPTFLQLSMSEDINKEIIIERIAKKLQPYLQGKISSNDFLNSLDIHEYKTFVDLSGDDMSIFLDLEIENTSVEKILKDEEEIENKIQEINALNQEISAQVESAMT